MHTVNIWTKATPSPPRNHHLHGSRLTVPHLILNVNRLLDPAKSSDSSISLMLRSGSKFLCTTPDTTPCTTPRNSTELVKDWYNTHSRRLGPRTYLWFIAIQCKYSKTLRWEPIRKRFHRIWSSIRRWIWSKKWSDHQSIWRQPQIHRYRGKSTKSIWYSQTKSISLFFG